MLNNIRRAVKFLLLAILAAIFVFFAVDNRQFVNISLFPLPYSAELPLFLLAILCFALGALAGWIGITMKLSKSRRLLKTEHKRVVALEDEVRTLHVEKRENLPINR